MTSNPSTNISVRLDDALLASLDAYIESQPQPFFENRSAAIRFLLRLSLETASPVTPHGPPRRPAAQPTGSMKSKASKRQVPASFG